MHWIRTADNLGSSRSATEGGNKRAGNESSSKMG